MHASNCPRYQSHCLYKIFLVFFFFFFAKPVDAAFRMANAVEQFYEGLTKLWGKIFSGIGRIHCNNHWTLHHPKFSQQCKKEKRENSVSMSQDFCAAICQLITMHSCKSSSCGDTYCRQFYSKERLVYVLVARVTLEVHLLLRKCYSNMLCCHYSCIDFEIPRHIGRQYDCLISRTVNF